MISKSLYEHYRTGYYLFYTILMLKLVPTCVGYGTGLLRRQRGVDCGTGGAGTGGSGGRDRVGGRRHRVHTCNTQTHNLTYTVARSRLGLILIHYTCMHDST